MNNPYSNGWVFNILKQRYNVKMEPLNRCNVEQQCKQKWKIRKIKNVQQQNEKGWINENKKEEVYEMKMGSLFNCMG